MGELLAVAKMQEAAVLVMDPLVSFFTIILFAFPYIRDHAIAKRDHEHQEALAGDSGGHSHGEHG